MCAHEMMVHLRRAAATSFSGLRQDNEECQSRNDLFEGEWPSNAIESGVLIEDERCLHVLNTVLPQTRAIGDKASK
jgi:hypothetical protein